MQRSRVKSGAFTLVELLVVIGIIAILIAILLPALNKARQEAIGIQCMARMRELNNACLLYATNSQGYLPPMMFAADTASHYVWPSIFPAPNPGGGTEPCYLTPFFSSGDTAHLYVCPSLQDTVPYSTVGYQSYMCNAYLFGLSWYNWMSKLAPYPGIGSTASPGGILAPMRLSQIRQSTLMATFIDGNVNVDPFVQAIDVTGLPGIRHGPGNGLDGLWFREDTACGTSATVGFNYHMPTPCDDWGQVGTAANAPWAPGVIFHSFFKSQGSYTASATLVAPKESGNVNVAFADGSVRTVYFNLNEAFSSGLFKSQPGLNGQMYVVPNFPQPRW